MQTKLRLAIAVLLGIISVCGLSAQELPFFDGFEDAGKHGEWTFVHSSSRNKWHIGTATAAQGANSLYVSADGGVTPGYANDASGIAAYITLQLPAGTYNVSFDYRVVGETDTKGVGLDSLFVYWVTDPNERIAETKGDRPEVLSVYRQQINSVDGTKDPSLWYNTTFQARVRDGSMPVRLTFYWICNSSNIVPPGACIDNIQVWAADAACATPENFTVSHENGAKLMWDETSAGSYQVYYKNNTTGEEQMISGIEGSPYNCSGLDKGVYTFWLRGICGTDTSAWATYSNHVLAVSTDKCINFIDIHNPDVVLAQYGKYGQSAQSNTGVMDFGSSNYRSQHTVHLQQGEYDPMTNGQLLTIPPGELASVRLGNWDGGSEAECLTYKLTVDASNPILIIKYAAVMQNVGHNGEDFKQPRFIIRVTDAQGIPLNETCLSVNYLTGSPTMPPGWNRIPMGGGGDDSQYYIEWKNWTTMGMNLSDYIGREVRVYLETGDCGPAPGKGCYGYAYFTMDCVSDKLSGLTCGAHAEEHDTIWAPAGFRYEWVKVTDPTRVLYTDQFFVPQAGDTATYRCRMNFVDPGREACAFELTASLLPRYPAADADYTICRKTVSFTDRSYVFTNNGITDEKCQLMWDFGDGVGFSEEQDPVYEYAEPGTYEVRLLASIDEGMCDSLWVDTITVSADTLKTIDTVYICKGDMVLFGDEYKREAGVYSDTLVNAIGCDSISVLDLRVHDTYADSVICGGDAFVFEGETLILESGTHELTYKNIKSVFGCDSILRLEVSDAITVEAQNPICADDPEAYFTVLTGVADSVRIDLGSEDFSPVTVAITNNVFAMPLDGSVKAGHYTGRFTFYNEFCGESEVTLDFQIMYPSIIIAQRWNDVLAVKNEQYNGGYDFEGASFQWYQNGEPMAGETSSILYLPDTKLDFESEYSVYVIEVSGREGMSCVVQPEQKDVDDIVVVMMNAASKANVAKVKAPEKLTMRVIDLTGIVHGIYEVNEGESQFTLPSTPGVYLLEMSYPSGRREIHKVVVR